MGYLILESVVVVRHSPVEKRFIARLSRAAVSRPRRPVREACAVMTIMCVNVTTIACGRTPPEVATPQPVPIEPSPPATKLIPLPEADTLTLIGRWEGIGKQESGPTWKMVLTIDTLAVGKCATVSYPSIPCGGHWVCSEPSDGFVLTGVEVITTGVGLCHNEVPVMIRLARDGQSAQFLVEAGPDSAEANLRRGD